MIQEDRPTCFVCRLMWDLQSPATSLNLCWQCNISSKLVRSSLCCTMECGNMESACGCSQNDIIVDGDDNIKFGAILPELFLPKTFQPSSKPMSFTHANIGSEIALCMGLKSHLTLTQIEVPHDWSAALCSFAITPKLSLSWPCKTFSWPCKTSHRIPRTAPHFDSSPNSTVSYWP